MNYKVGDVFNYKRSFTIEDVLHFAEITGDKGKHHIIPDEQGRVIVHGLLTASLPTKIGGDLNFLIRNVTNEFLRPVYSGETINCKVTLALFESIGKFYKLKFNIECTNEKNKIVLKGVGDGVVKKE